MSMSKSKSKSMSMRLQSLKANVSNKDQPNELKRINLMNLQPFSYIPRFGSHKYQSNPASMCNEYTRPNDFRSIKMKTKKMPYPDKVRQHKTIRSLEIS